MTLSAALRTSEILVAWAVLLQSVELYRMRADFRERCGIWRWSDLRRDYEGVLSPIGRMLAPLMSERGFELVLIARGVFALNLLADESIAAVLLGLLAASTLAISLRFRGSFNGGSDSMTLWTLLALFVARVFVNAHVTLAMALLIALQLCLSYLIAGIAKLARPEWRAGLALKGFVRSETYAVPELPRRWLTNPRASFVGGWAVMLFECAFPLALLSQGLAQVLIAVAILFHLGNAYVFGLNRFFWAWLAGYPALLACAGYLWRS